MATESARFAVASSFIAQLQKSLGSKEYLPSEREVFYIARQVHEVARRAIAIRACESSSINDYRIAFGTIHVAPFGCQALDDSFTPNSAFANIPEIKPENMCEIDYRAVISHFVERVRHLVTSGVELGQAQKEGFALSYVAIMSNRLSVIRVGGGDWAGINECAQSLDLPCEQFALKVELLISGGEVPRDTPEDLTEESHAAVASAVIATNNEIIKDVLINFDVKNAESIGFGASMNSRALYKQMVASGTADRADVQHALASLKVSECRPEAILAAREMGLTQVDAALESVRNFSRQSEQLLEKLNSLNAPQVVLQSQKRVIQEQQYFIRAIERFKPQLERYFES